MDISATDLQKVVYHSPKCKKIRQSTMIEVLLDTAEQKMVIVFDFFQV